LRRKENTVGKHISIATYWLGSVCAALALLARALDLLGKNFLDFNTKGSGIGYHSFMDGTLFFYAISIATTVYLSFHSQKSEPSVEQTSETAR
jgi:hypothetical protein